MIATARQSLEPLRPLPLRTALTRSEHYPHVHIALTWHELVKIGKLRFMQYVQAQHKTYRSSVLVADCLVEPADTTGVNIYAEANGAISAVMRIGLVSDPLQPFSDDCLAAADYLGLDTSVALTCTRLAKSPEHAGSHAADLIRFVRLQTVQAGYRYCIMQTAERLVPYFSRFEFRPSGRVVQSAAAGPLHIMVLDTRCIPVQPPRSPHVIGN